MTSGYAKLKTSRLTNVSQVTTWIVFSISKKPSAWPWRLNYLESASCKSRLLRHIPTMPATKRSQLCVITQRELSLTSPSLSLPLSTRLSTMLSQARRGPLWKDSSAGHRYQQGRGVLAFRKCLMVSRTPSDQHSMESQVQGCSAV